MTTSAYIPPKVWQFDAENGGAFAGINRPTAGARTETKLPVGKHALQLYSLATPNGIKVTILLEELLELGLSGAEYDAWLIDIRSGAQFGSDFVAINPNSKIPALLDHSSTPPTRLFESGSILLYLAEKFGVFLGENAPQRTEILNWLFWQMGSAPFVGGGFGHFYVYAPEKFEYPINRYAMETKRQLDVLERQLSQQPYVAGTNYSIADIAIWPWYGQLVLGQLYNAAEFLAVHEYPQLQAWAARIAARSAVQRGLRVNRNWGPEELQLPERHSSADFNAAAISCP
jgi:GST-like protein